MSLTDLTPESVREALAEFDRIGRDSFLKTYGFGKARSYFLVHNDQFYDSKAVAGVAHKYLPGRSFLKAADFSGGEYASPAQTALSAMPKHRLHHCVRDADPAAF